VKVLSGCRISKWIRISVACLAAVCAVVVATFAWFGSYMSEGVLHTETLQGNVLVALSDFPPVRQALLSSCRSP
jgi:hypothetical protein